MRKLFFCVLVLACVMGNPAGSASGELPATWPIPGPPPVLAGFDPPAQPWLAGHRGADLMAALGTPVLAPIGGVVEVAGTIVDRGVVVIRDGDIRISLEPVDPAVARGSHVEVGDVIGLLSPGRSHCAPASCLHWGLRVGGEYRDPLLLVRRYQAVLLP